MIWCCPRCRASLTLEQPNLVCQACERQYPAIDGIPDLRLDVPAWIDFAEDRQRARDLIERISPNDVAGAVEFVFRRREGWSDALVERRVRQVLELPRRLSLELDEWLAPLREDGILLDIGCGPGTLLAAAATGDREMVGVDISMEWLVVAQRMVRSAGGEPQLACALAEALPLRDGSVSCVAVLDVIEHVSNPSALVAEVNRVVRTSGVLVLATPNRFSLAAEPHVGVWGVGWLPARLQDWYVRKRTGKSYGFVRLLSRRELRQLFRRNSDIGIQIRPARIPREELRTFAPGRALLARVYNELASRRVPARIASPVSPFFHVVGRRR